MSVCVSCGSLDATTSPMPVYTGWWGAGSNPRRKLSAATEAFYRREGFIALQKHSTHFGQFAPGPSRELQSVDLSRCNQLTIASVKHLSRCAVLQDLMLRDYLDRERCHRVPGGVSRTAETGPQRLPDTRHRSRQPGLFQHLARGKPQWLLRAGSGIVGVGTVYIIRRCPHFAHFQK